MGNEESSAEIKIINVKSKGAPKEISFPNYEDIDMIPPLINNTIFGERFPTDIQIPSGSSMQAFELTIAYVNGLTFHINKNQTAITYHMKRQINGIVTVSSNLKKRHNELMNILSNVNQEIESVHSQIDNINKNLETLEKKANEISKILDLPSFSDFKPNDN